MASERWIIFVSHDGSGGGEPFSGFVDFLGSDEEAMDAGAVRYRAILPPPPLMPEPHDEAREELAKLVAAEFRDEIPDDPADDLRMDFPWRALYQSVADRIIAAGWTRPAPVDANETPIGDTQARLPIADAQQAGDVREAAAQVADRHREEHGAAMAVPGLTPEARMRARSAVRACIGVARAIRALPAPEVTEEMVERALAAVAAGFNEDSVEYDDADRAVMRAALTAALQPGEGK